MLIERVFDNTFTTRRLFHDMYFRIEIFISVEYLLITRVFSRTKLFCTYYYNI